ncbi:MAG TPA: hypothetical protein VF060_27495 [Trebonia sp.]
MTATLASGKFSHSVLKTEVAGGSDRTYATLAPEAFGEGIASIKFTAATQRQFRLTQLNTPASRLKLAAVVLGAISAAVTATLPMTTGTAQLALRWLAAFLAVAAPVLAWTGSSWFS